MSQSHADYIKFYRLIKDYISVDLTILLIILLLLIGLASDANNRYRRHHRKRTRIEVQVGNDIETKDFLWKKLQLSPDFYTFRVTREDFRLRLHERVYGYALLLGEVLMVQNKAITMNINLPLEIPICWPWNRKLMELISAPYFVAISIVGSRGQMVNVILIKPYEVMKESTRTLDQPRRLTEFWYRLVPPYPKMP